MFTLEQEPQVIHRSKKLYISFPDILQSIYNKDKLFLIYRSGEFHHPLHSLLHFWISNNKGKSWVKTHEFKMDMDEHGRVWNCPRLSYFPDGTLNIISDSKDSTNERKALFVTYKLVSYNDGNDFEEPEDIGIYGMLPDHIVKFKNNLYIANHLNDLKNKTLVQFVNASRDNGQTWYDRNIVGRENHQFYCEGSALNYYDNYLLMLVRDNARGPHPMHSFISLDGKNWKHKEKIPICGHRPTILFNQNKEKNNRVFMSYRDTNKMAVCLSTFIVNRYGNCSDFEIFDIEKEKKCNLFNFGYTGLTEYEKNKFLLTYYITKENAKPYIKIAKLTWTPNN